MATQSRSPSSIGRIAAATVLMQAVFVASSYLFGSLSSNWMRFIDGAGDLEFDYGLNSWTVTYGVFAILGILIVYIFPDRSLFGAPVMAAPSIGLLCGYAIVVGFALFVGIFILFLSLADGLTGPLDRIEEWAVNPRIQRWIVAIVASLAHVGSAALVTAATSSFRAVAVVRR